MERRTWRTALVGGLVLATSSCAVTPTETATPRSTTAARADVASASSEGGSPFSDELAEILKGLTVRFGTANVALMEKLLEEWDGAEPVDLKALLDPDAAVAALLQAGLVEEQKEGPGTVTEAQSAPSDPTRPLVLSADGLKLLDANRRSADPFDAPILVGATAAGTALAPGLARILVLFGLAFAKPEAVIDELLELSDIWRIAASMVQIGWWQVLDSKLAMTASGNVHCDCHAEPGTAATCPPLGFDIDIHGIAEGSPDALCNASAPEAARSAGIPTVCIYTCTAWY